MPKKKVKNKNINSSKKDLGRSKETSKEKPQEHMLYVWSDGIGWIKLPQRTPFSDFNPGSELKIFTSSDSTTVLQMQYPPWRKRGRILQKNVTRNRKRKDG